MSRFEDTLQRDLAVIADRATPSPQAWQQIHRRIIDQEPIQETEIIMLTENTTRTRRWPLLAAAAALAALAIGAIALVNRGDTAEDPADTPEPTPTIAPTPDQDVGAGASATALPFGERWVSPGRYTTDELGVPIAFDLPREMWMTQNFRGELSFLGVVEGELTPENFTMDNGFSLQFFRVAGWSTSEEAQSSRNTGSIDPDDIDGWLASNDLTVSDDDVTEIDGRAARVIQYRAAPNAMSADACLPGTEPCIFTNAIAYDLATERGDAYTGSTRDERMYVVTIEGSEPLLIRAGGDGVDEGAWFDEFEAELIANIELGPDAPPLNYTAPEAIVGDRAPGSSSVEGIDSVPTGDATLEETRAFLDEWIEAWNAGDTAAVAAAFGSDAVFTEPGGMERIGVAAGDHMANVVASMPALRRLSDGSEADNGAYSFDVEWEGSWRTLRPALILTIADGNLVKMVEQFPNSNG